AISEPFRVSDYFKVPEKFHPRTGDILTGAGFPCQFNDQVIVIRSPRAVVAEECRRAAVGAQDLFKNGEDIDLASVYYLISLQKTGEDGFLGTATGQYNYFCIEGKVVYAFYMRFDDDRDSRWLVTAWSDDRVVAFETGNRVIRRVMPNPTN
ncbi:MAG: hypothetical protein WC797_04000, partial [Candidatus Paceibacterota bacterium]